MVLTHFPKVQSLVCYLYTNPLYPADYIKHKRFRQVLIHGVSHAITEI